MSPRIKPAAPDWSAAPGRRIRLRPRVFAVLICLFGLGFGAQIVWNYHAARISQHPQYQLTAEQIRVTPPPPWIRCDVKIEALRDAGLVGSLSLLDDWETFSRRIKDAFEFHPWVASVERISRRLPAALDVELTYRKPVAAVESNDSSGVTFLPIDAQAVRLPEGDFTDIERRYLPRIVGAVGRPLVGDTWDDPRVVGGAKLAAALGDVWQSLRLVEIFAKTESQSPDHQPRCTFEIVTSGGTRIVWGGAPGQETLSDESTVDIKRQRLLDYAAQHGHLDSIDGPERLDVRTGLIVTPRTARRAPPNSEANIK